jgi:hypothetical protein
MNVRVFALGVLLGLTVAYAPSCTNTARCDATVCDGCCSADGVCRGGNAASACGTGGAACTTCAAGDTCTEGGTCAAALSACKEPCPRGCCGPDGTCTAGRLPEACGGGGQSCQACPSGTQCVARADGNGNACVGATVGSACTDDAQCRGALGQTAVCKRTTSSGLGTYGGGYCTLPCQSDSQCGANNACAPPGALADFGESDSLCIKGCAAQSDCRTDAGYACYGTTTSGICWLDPLPPRDGGPPVPAAVMGAPCTRDGGECGPPDQAGCILATQSDGGASSFAGGYCTADCLNVAGEKCGPEGVCVGFGDPVEQALCFKACQVGAPNPVCRPGYVCSDLDGAPATPQGICFPGCDAPGQGCATGQSCIADGGVDNGYCQLPDGGILR